MKPFEECFVFPKKMNKKATETFLLSQRLDGNTYSWRTVHVGKAIYYTSSHGT